MPELPEVETVRRGLAQRALGRRVTAVEVLNPLVVVGSRAKFIATITGRSITTLQRKGKALVIGLEDEHRSEPRYLLLRLGMTGQFIAAPRTASLLPHTHLRLALDGGAEELRYRDVRRFGRLRCCTRRELDGAFTRLGPDAREITEGQFLTALEGRRGAIKSWLMNQQFLSGLGNIYADESLFAAHIHPLTPAGQLSSVAAHRLHRAMKKILDRAVTLGGTSVRDYVNAEGRPGGFRIELRVYQRTGQPCRRCRRPIRRIIIAGRSSHFCPHCQPQPRNIARRRGSQD